MNNIVYHKAIELLLEVSQPNGFLASAEKTDNLLTDLFAIYMMVKSLYKLLFIFML